MEKTLVFYISTLASGGAERVMTQLVNSFSKFDYNVILVTTYKCETEYAIDANVERIVLEPERKAAHVIKKNLRCIRKLREICKEKKAQVMISFMREPNMRALLATRGLSTKNIISVRSDPLHEYAGILGYLLGQFFLPLADGCVFQTKEAMKWFPVRLQKKSKIILNAVADEFFCTTRSNCENIVTIGRLDRGKNQRMLIEAFAAIAEKYPDEQLLIYGEGELRDELQNLIDALKLKDRISLMGYTSDVPSLLSRTKLFVLPSDFEGLPNALMEAMAAGVPSISTDCPCGGPKMLIDNGVNGILVPVGDKRKISEAMDYLLSHEEEAGEIGRKAAERAARYRRERIFMEWENYLNEFIDEK